MSANAPDEPDARRHSVVPSLSDDNQIFEQTTEEFNVATQSEKFSHIEAQRQTRTSCPETIEAISPAADAAGSPASSSSKRKAGSVQHALYPFVDDKGSFSLDKLLEARLDQIKQNGDSLRTVGVAWRNLTVTGVGLGYREQTTMTSLLLPNIRSLFSRSPKPVKTILDSLSGTLLPGQMLLVLGRPGAGCTSFLKTLASYRDGFHSVTGDLLYTALSVKDIEGKFRGDVVFAPEDDVHFPTLTVDETLTFAAAMRTPQAQSRFPFPSDVPAASGETQMSPTMGPASRKEAYRSTTEVLAAILGLRHTFNTKVGNDTIRGISGGERKRVTVGETMASRAKLILFDNSSRGLDSSTALEFVHSLRVCADIFRLAIVASLYQASDNITQSFDKVLVLNKGRQAFFGRVENAVAYFERLGFRRQDRQTIADFLVACASGQPPECRFGTPRQLAPDSSPESGSSVDAEEGDHRDRFIRPPYLPEEQKEAWRASPNAEQVEAEVQDFLKTYSKAASERTYQQYCEQLRKEKATTTRFGSSYTISTPMQIRWAVLRRWQILMNDRATQLTPLISSVLQGLILGTVFFDMPANSTNVFPRGSVLFAALLILALNSMAEITRCYAQRPIVIRHRKFGFLHPFADALADLLIDVPTQFINLLFFSAIFYFMTGLARSVEQYFVFFFTTFLVTLCMGTFFRMLAAAFRHESRATMFAGVAVLILIVYTGYVIPRPTMRVFWRWLSYANPSSFGFEILLANEFRRLQIRCMSMVPNGASYANVDIANQVCPISGAQPGQLMVDGPAYLLESFGYKWSNAPRNAAIIIAFWLSFIAVFLLASEWQQDPLATASVMVYKRGSPILKEMDGTKTESIGESKGKDMEKAIELEDLPSNRPNAHIRKSRKSEDEHKRPRTEDDDLYTISSTRSSIFSWRDVCYDVEVKGGHTRRLLRNVSGFVMPGKMMALMGESGAGKTTLLNVLAQRVTTGVVTGKFLVDGLPISASFQRSTGYCQQQDIHLDTQTVREALEFSALLRQPASVPREEKLAYVQYVIQLLEMEPFADAIVGHVGEGLNLEQRKLLTVGVELAARPKLLIFLDEPTSGLDSTAARSIVRLLQKLARTGQAILCTIHQPSGELFNQFDSLLLLQKGGKTVFFGETGENSSKLIEYFESLSDKKCGPGDNPAEYILDVIGAGATASSDIDWYGAFLQSHLNRELQNKLGEIDQRSHQALQTTSDDDDEEYATPFSFQLQQSLKRIFVHYHRSTTYLSSKIGLNLIAGLFLGSSFWGRGEEQSVASINNKVFSVFMALCLSAPLSQQLQPVFIQFRTLYEAREKPSKMYSWPVAVLTPMLVEGPWNVLAATWFWLCWYWMVDFPSGKTAGIVWGALMLYQFFFASLAQWLAAMARNTTMASLFFTAAFSFICMFCGVLQPPQSLPKFWRSWMYHLSPLTYAIEAFLGPIFEDRPLRCTTKELFTIVPPVGQTCAMYLANFTASIDSVNAFLSSGATTQPNGRGYYTHNDDGTCGYCPYRRGHDYLSTTESEASRWGRDLGILVAFVAFNYGLCLISFYMFRVANFKLTLPLPAIFAKRLPSLAHKTDRVDAHDQDTFAMQTPATSPTPLRQVHCRETS